MTYKYDPKVGRLSTAMAVANTVVPSVLMSLEFWLFFLLHLALFICFRLGLLFTKEGKLDPSMIVNWDFVKVITGMTTFFEVFYTNQCYSRYLNFYKLTKSMINDAFAFASNLRTYCGESPGHVRIGVRYMVAAILVHFLQMKGEVSDREWDELCRLQVLRTHEVTALRTYGGSRKAIFVLNWSCVAALDGCAKLNAPNSAKGNMPTILLRIRAQQQEIVDTLALPVPYQYFHLLNIMVVMNLALWAYSMALTDSIFSPVVFFFAALIFIGMMDLSSMLSDPFGTDEVDFPINNWLSECFENLVELVEHEYPGGPQGMQNAIAVEGPMARGTRDVKVAVSIELSEAHLLEARELAAGPLSSCQPSAATARSPGGAYSSLLPVSDSPRPETLAVPTRHSQAGQLTGTSSKT